MQPFAHVRQCQMDALRHILPHQLRVLFQRGEDVRVLVVEALDRALALVPLLDVGGRDRLDAVHQLLVHVLQHVAHLMGGGYKGSARVGEKGNERVGQI